MKNKKQNIVGRLTAEYRRFDRRLCLSAETRRIRKQLSLDHAEPCLGIRTRGGLGDHIVGARFLRDLQAEVGYFKFDLFTPSTEIGRWLFSSFPGFRNCYCDQYLWRRAHQYYPLALEINQLFVPAFKTADWSEVGHHYPKLLEICFVVEKQLEPLEACSRYHPFLDGHLSRVAVFMGARRHNFMHKLCGIQYRGDRLNVKAEEGAIRKFGLLNQRFITISNGFDAVFNHRTSRPTKVYPHFGEVIKSVKDTFPTLKIVQVGSQTSVPLEYVDLNLISSTSLMEVTSLIRNAELHIDNEGGLVHVAGCVGTTCCVLFGPTDASYFGYEMNLNVGPAICGNCYWITKEWMNSCVRGYETPRCLSELSPAQVYERIHPCLSKKFMRGAVGLVASAETNSVVQG